MTSILLKFIITMNVQYAVVQYLFEDGVEVPILPPHGNSKQQQPYHRTQPSDYYNVITKRVIGYRR